MYSIHVFAVSAEDWQGEADSDAELNSVSVVSSRGRRIRQLLRVPPPCQFMLHLLCD